MSTKFETTERVLAEMKRAVEALSTIRKTDVNANGVFIQPRQKLVALKASHQHIDRQSKQSKANGCSERGGAAYMTDGTDELMKSYEVIRSIVMRHSQYDAARIL